MEVAYIVEVQYVVHAMHKPIIKLLPTELGLAVSLCKVLQVRQASSEKDRACVAVQNLFQKPSAVLSQQKLAITLILPCIYCLSQGSPGSTACSLGPGRSSLITCCTKRTSALSQGPSLTSGCLGITSSDCTARVAAARSLEAVLCRCS